MLVNVTRNFEFGGRQYLTGQNVDVDTQIARQWITNGQATQDTDGNQDWPSPALQALVSGAGIPWASRPSAATAGAGALLKISDIPQVGGGAIFVSDGARWCKYEPTQIAGSAAAASALTGTLSETVVASFTLPGGLLGPNGTLDIETRWTVNNTANAKVVRHYLGASVMHSVSPASGTYIGLQTALANRNVQNAQVGGAVNLFGTPFAGGNTLATATIDTSVDQTVSIRAQLANVADTMVLESWRALFTSRG